MPTRRAASPQVPSPPVQTEHSRDEIVRVLEHEIATAKLKPGERLDERVLAARFGVSRAPVRDAIGRLASLGFIVVKPRSGSYVNSLSASEVLQLLEVMAGVEGLCAFHAAQRMGTAERNGLRELAERSRDAAENSAEEYITVNLDFHVFIYAGTQNSELERLARQLRQRISAYRNYALRLPARLSRSAADHLAISHAVAAGDAYKAQELMVAHCDIRRDEFAQFIKLIEG